MPYQGFRLCPVLPRMFTFDLTKRALRGSSSAGHHGQVKLTALPPFGIMTRWEFREGRGIRVGIKPTPHFCDGLKSQQLTDAIGVAAVPADGRAHSRGPRRLTPKRPFYILQQCDRALMLRH